MAAALLNLWCLYGRVKQRRSVPPRAREELQSLCLAASAAMRGGAAEGGRETARAALWAVLDAIDDIGLGHEAPGWLNSHARRSVRPVDRGASAIQNDGGAV